MPNDNKLLDDWQVFFSIEKNCKLYLHSLNKQKNLFSKGFSRTYISQKLLQKDHSIWEYI